MIGFPKPRPRLLDKRQSAAERAELDRQQRALCRLRSQGRCEVREVCGSVVLWCVRQASENHHLIGGWGRRNRGKSILAEHRLEVCQRHHEEITHHVLVPSVEASLACLANAVKYERRS